MTVRYLSSQIVMKKCGISYSTLLRWVKGRKIPFIRMGRSLKFPSSFFERLEQKALSKIAGGKKDADKRR